MSAFRQASDFNEAGRIPEQQIASRRVVDGKATREPCFCSTDTGEQAAFAMVMMILGRKNCEGERRSWRIAICCCDAVAHNFVAFSRKPLLRPLESSYKFSSRILELEMHSAVLRFTFRDDAGMCQSLAVFRP